MKTIVCFLVVIAAIFSCAEKKKKSVVSTDVDMVSRTLSLPFVPISSICSVESLQIPSRFPGPEDFVIYAVVTFNAEDFEALKLKVRASEEIQENIYLPKGFIREWFPSSVRKKIHFDGELNTIIGGAYTAKLFYREPYLSGYCFFTDQREVFICLYTQ
jgi:hypothetical protein